MPDEKPRRDARKIVFDMEDDVRRAKISSTSLITA
jgi:hypothetical protein